MGNSQCCSDKIQVDSDFVYRENISITSPRYRVSSKSTNKDQVSEVSDINLSSNFSNSLNRDLSEILQNTSRESDRIIKQISKNKFRDIELKSSTIDLIPAGKSIELPELLNALLESLKTKMLEKYQFYKKIKNSSNFFNTKTALSFFGEIREGCIEGYGQIFFHDNALYEGEITKNKPNGYGIFIYNEDLVYYGEFSHGKREGEGTLEKDGKIQ